MTKPADAMQGAYACIDRLQDFPSHISVAAVAILFNEMSTVLNLPVSELVDKAQKITKDLNQHYQVEIKALREFIKHEMSK